MVLTESLHFDTLLLDLLLPVPMATWATAVLMLHVFPACQISPAAGSMTEFDTRLDEKLIFTCLSYPPSEPAIYF